MYDCPLSNVPLPSRLGTQLFELRPSLDPFAEDEEDQHPVGHVLFDAATKALVIGDTKVPDADVMYCDITDTVCWLASGAQLCEGRLSFTSDCREAIGTVTCRNGERVVVTGSAMLPSGNGDGAPPAYGANLMSTAIASNMSGFGSAGSPFMMLAATTGGSAGSGNEKEEKIYITEFKTERRKLGSTDDDDWSPWHSLEWGMEMKTSGTPVVCYVDDVDITDSTTFEHGNNETVIVKTEGDPTNKKLDYTFRVVMGDAVEEKDQKFTGVWEQNEKKWEWKGTFRATKERSRTPSAGPNVGPDGKTVTQLMSVTSLKPTTKEVVVEVEQPDGTTKPEKKIMTEDMAQEEADRIFARIILHSAPADVIKALNPDIKPLDAQEKKIAETGPKYLELAAIVNVMTFLKNTESVDAKQRERIDENKCKAFVRACAAFDKPKEGATDWAKEWGWDRENTKDAAEMNQVQKEYRAVAQACYRLGYRRAVGDFQPFLKNPTEWYNLFTDYLLSPLGVRELAARVKRADLRIQHDIYDWQNKLQVLQEEAGPDFKPLHQITDVMNSLTATATFATMDGIAWSSELASNITKFFEDLEVIEKDEKSGKETVFTKMGKASDEAMREKADDWEKLRKSLGDRDNLTWSEFGKALVAGLDDHAKQLNRIPSVAELTTVVSHNEATGGFWPKAWQKGKAALKKAIRGAVVVAGASFIAKTLAEGNDTLDVAEKVSMYASLIDAASQMWNGVSAAWSAMIKTKPGKFVGRVLVSIAKGLGNGIRKLLPARALQWINAAAKWGKNVVSKLTNSVSSATTAIRGFFTKNWARIAKGISLAFGFFVSVATLVASAFEFDKALKDPKATTMDKVFAGSQLLFAALSTVAFAVQIVASIANATAVAAIAGTIGIWLAGIGIVIAIIALIWTLTRPREDPIKDIIDKYGPKYKLLK